MSQMRLTKLATISIESALIKKLNLKQLKLVFLWKWKREKLLTFF